MVDIVAVSGWSLPERSLEWTSSKVIRACDVEEFDFSGIETLVGYSLGAIKLLELALLGKVLPKKLVLLSPSLKFSEDVAFLRTSVKKDYKAALRKFYRWHKLKSESDWSLNQLLEGLEYLDTVDLRETAKKIDVNLIVFGCSSDRLIAWGDSKSVADTLDGQFTLIESNLGHGAFTQTVEQVMEVL